MNRRRRRRPVRPARYIPPPPAEDKGPERRAEFFRLLRFLFFGFLFRR